MNRLCLEILYLLRCVSVLSPLFICIQDTDLLLLESGDIDI